MKLARLLCVVAAGLYALFALPYAADGLMVRYGRASLPRHTASWNLWKLHRFDEARRRAHPGGRVAWIVGSSILREAFDEAAINEALEARGSAWRVFKLVQLQGASGLSWGFVKRLPLRPGDRLVHGLTMENFRRGWLTHMNVPAWRVSVMLDRSEIWQIEEWSVQTKLEQSFALPGDFFAFHDEHWRGVSRWLSAPLDGRPRMKRRSHHIKYRTTELSDRLQEARADQRVAGGQF